MALLCCCLRLILSILKFAIGTLYSFCVFELRRLKKTDTFFTILREFLRSVWLSFIVSGTVDVKAKANSDR